MKIYRWLILAATMGAAACAPTLRENFHENISKHPWTREQKAVAEDYGYRLVFGKMLEEGKFDVMYSRLPKDRVVAQSKKYVDNLKAVLDRQNRQIDKYNESFGLRPYWEQQEKIFKAIYGRALADMLNDTFEQAIGERMGSYGSRDEFGFDHRDGYDPSIYTVTDLGKKFPFESKLINEAKEGGVLELIETHMVESSRKYDHKEPDPSAPDDPNKFVWRDKKYSLKVTKFKIVVPGETPKDSFTNYIEVTRVVNGKEESKPCIKAFLNGGSMALAVIDIDHESDKLGFGLPDAVERMPETAIVDQKTIDRLYPDSEEYKRQEPKYPPVRAEIAPVGTEVDMWVACSAPICDPAKGWRVPFTYKNDDEDGYTIDLKFKKVKNGDVEKEHSHKLREVEYIEKHWSFGSGAGSVIEYFKPKSPFNQKVVSASVRSHKDMRLEFVLEDGSERSGVVTSHANQFIGDRPETIAFTLGEKRYQIKDADGNGTYEKRREVTEESPSDSSRAGHSFAGPFIDLSTGPSTILEQ
jgi:hypothetical protein